MAKFEVGQTVWMGRGASLRELVVEKVHKNPMLPVHQYTFEGYNFACGEQSIRATKDGRDLKLSECFVDDNEADFRINTIANAMRQNVDERQAMVPEMKFFDSTRVRFRPSLDMCKWFKDYADGRMIVHVDSGQGHFVRMLKMAKAKAIGIEENFNLRKAIEIRSVLRGYIGDINEILEGTFESKLKFLHTMSDKILLVFPRPKKNDNLRLAIQEFYGKTEILLIENEASPDLDVWKKLDHDGVSEDGELVYSLK